MDLTRLDWHNFTFQQMFHFSSRLLAGLVILTLFWVLTHGLKLIIARLGRQFTQEKKPIFDLLGYLSQAGILIMGIITALGSMGVNINALVASVGLSSFAISFAMQDALSNVLAGIMILLYQPFKKGNFIKVGDFEGKVIDIDLRCVTLSKDNKKILIPNAKLINQAVVLDVST